jgi:chlorite dismutase
MKTATFSGMILATQLYIWVHQSADYPYSSNFDQGHSNPEIQFQTKKISYLVHIPFSKQNCWYSSGM